LFENYLPNLSTNTNMDGGRPLSFILKFTFGGK
jgi:hypothetical protein